MAYLDGQTQKSYYDKESFGSYQFVSLEDVVSQFMVAYVGDEKNIRKVSRTDVAFHAQRGLAELSFDTLKSFKSLELEVPPSLCVPVPRDYVNYTNISWIDASGIKHRIYLTKYTSNPFSPVVDDDNDFVFDTDESFLKSGELVVNGNFQGTVSVMNSGENNPTFLPENNWYVQLATEEPSTFDNNNDPLAGWFFIDNKATCIDIQFYDKIRQYNSQILSNGSYKVTYTVSNYSSGAVGVFLVDEKGKTKQLTLRTENGTFEETVDMTTATYPDDGVVGSSNFWIQNGNSTAVGNFTIDNFSIVRVGSENDSVTSQRFQSITPAENDNNDYKNDDYQRVPNERYGLDPAFAQTNGSFFIDELRGKINFSSNISGKIIVIDYISDSLGTEAEMQVHKFAEEAIYRYINYAILSTKSNVAEYVVRRAKKEKFAAVRQAKLRLSSIKLEDITQTLRGKSKQIKH
jgi:hypothetical protein